MQIVIDITEETYLRIIRPDRLATDNDINAVMWAVYNGTLLPKRHGRLVEYNKIKVEEDVYNQCYVVSAPTVLEADTESEE